MDRRLVISNAGRSLVSWIARETIYFGQIVIRTAYRWLKWSERQ